MQSPPIEWTLDIGKLVLKDVIRNIGDPDHDTLSEVIRPWARAHPLLFVTASLGTAAWWLWHIDPLSIFRPDV